tara:strand:- start:2615 stop:3376 length:762 start_codon:yes stop_codon:yes gene_type:complete
MQILKNSYNFLKYQTQSLNYPKLNTRFDKDFISVNALRSSGIYIDNNFGSNNNSAKDLISFYDKIDKTKLKKHINDKASSKNKASYKIIITKFFDRDLLLSFAQNDFFIKNIQQYFGFEPFLREVRVVADIKNQFSDKPVYTQNFHRDYDDIKLVKSFFYLTDVDETNGPFQFLSKTHSKPWYNPGSLSEKNIFEKFNQKDLVSCVGNKGTLILADTNGLHRGLVLKKGYRYMVTAMYTSNNPRFGKLEEIVW